MAKSESRRLLPAAFLLALACQALTPHLGAQMVKKSHDSLDERVFQIPEIRVVETLADFESVSGQLANARDLAAFRSANGLAWRFTIDLRRGRTSLAEGGALSMLPGSKSGVTWGSVGAACPELSCVPVSEVERISRNFLGQWSGVFGVPSDELVLDPLGTAPVGSSIYLVRFQWSPGGVPVDGASVFLRFNSGNLIQVATEKIGPLDLTPIPSVSIDGAWKSLATHLGAPLQPKDVVLEKGKLIFVPATPTGLDPNLYTGSIGTMFTYHLAWKLSFRRPGVQGTWEARIDAKSGQVLSFGDANRYGHIQGGVYKTDKNPTQTEVSVPLPKADYGAGLYADVAGNFSGNSGTSALNGLLAGSNGVSAGVGIVDTCGAVSMAATGSGLIDFGGSGGTDCTTPGIGGAGNTHAARTQYWNVVQIMLKGISYLPTNTWLQARLTDNVDLAQTCNAYWNGTSLNFFQSGGGCGNTGELPGVSLHEWGHGMDDNDGSGGGSPPVETRADWTALLQTHESCAGGGFFVTLNRGCGNPPLPGTGFNCSGYGDCCTTCSGIRDADWNKHQYAFAWTPQNNGLTGATDPHYTCAAGGYNGPCGWEDHCESGIASQALWDFTNRDLIGPPTNMDVTSAWQLADRLYYTGMPTMTNMYSCTPGTPTVSSGCGGGALYTIMRAIDDDGDGTANGTPHAAAIFASLNRHRIACGLAGDATNQNQTSCPALTTPVLTGVAGSNSAVLTWTSGGASATRYLIFRNESSCTAGFTRVATVSAPTLNYTDTTVNNGLTYYYRIQAATANDSCVSPMSNCSTVTPQPCAGAVTLDSSVYSCSSTVTVSVLDSTINLPVTVQVFSTVDATPKTITLANLPPGSATYSGTFTTTISLTPGPTEVRVADGATLTGRYVDPTYCGVPNQTVTTTAAIDCVGPVISNVLVLSITDSSAVVTWTTNELANSRVTYGTSTPPGTIQNDLSNYVTSHSMTLAGLSTCTTYYFSVTSADASGNSTTDTKGGIYYGFTTAGRSFAMGPDSVEGGVLSWIASGPAGSVWHQDTCKSSSPTHAWKAGAPQGTCPGQYAVSIDTYLTWNTDINLGAAGHGYHLRWNEWYDTESGFDWLTPQISVNGGIAWSDLLTHYAGGSGGWLSKDVDLGAYTGNQVRIRFWMHSDISIVGEGWYVDDINISRSQACGADPRYQSSTRTDVCNGTGSGNANGILDPGEDSVVTVTMANGGMVSASNVSATLSSSTPGITVTDNSATFPNLASNGGAGVSQPNHFGVHVDPAVVCASTANFTLHAVCTENPSGVDSGFSMTVGQAGGAVTVFAEDFSGVTPAALPAGWTISKTSGNDWVTDAAGCANSALMYPYSTTQAANSWAYTPSMTLTAGVTYTLGFNQKVRSGTFPEAFEVKAGTAATPAGQTITILSLTNLVNTTCAARAPTFTVPVAGTYYIGWHCTSAVDMWDLYIDDILLTYTQAPSCSVCTSTCTAPGAPALTSATGTCAAVDLSWTAGTGSTLSYNVYRAPSPCGGAYVKVAGPIAATSYSDTSAIGGTSYAYVIKGACDAGGASVSPNSNCLTAARLVSPVPTITGAATNACPATTVSLSTEAGKSNYQWYVGAAPIGGATANSYNATASGTYTVSYKDPNGCSGTSAGKIVTIAACVVNVQYDGTFNPLTTLTELCGDGDAVVEPGEQWAVTVRLVNVGNSGATNTVGTLTVNPGSVVAATVTGNPGSFGSIAGGNGTGTATFQFLVDSGAACLANLTFDIRGIAANEGSFPSQIPAFNVPIGLATPPLSETGNQQTTPLNATSNTVTSNLTPAFTITAPSTATLSYANGYTQKPGATFTLFGPDDMTANVANWTGASAAWSAGTAHCAPHTNGDALLTANPASLTLTSAVSTVGYTNIHAKFDSKLSNVANSLFLEYFDGSAWVTVQTLTGSTAWACNNDVVLPVGAEGKAGFRIRFRLTGTAGRTANVDYVSVTGDTAPSGSWTANVRVELLDGANVSTILKAFGAGDASPYNVIAAYTGPGTYKVRLSENNGGTAALTLGSMNVKKNLPPNCAASSCGAPPAEAAPGTTSATAQSWTNKNTQSWPATPGATSYTMYRGVRADLPQLMNATVDSCTKWTGAGTSTSSLTDDPSLVAGGLYWYLLTASNANGEGTAGNGTFGPRIVNSGGVCP